MLITIMNKEKSIYATKWFADLLMKPYPHIIPIDEMYGYYKDRDNFNDTLFELELTGFITVDYFSGVQLTPKALSFLMANILENPTGNFRQVCCHILDRLGRECVDSSISRLFDKLFDSGDVIRFSELASHFNDDTF